MAPVIRKLHAYIGPGRSGMAHRTTQGLSSTLGPAIGTGDTEGAYIPLPKRRDGELESGESSPLNTISLKVGSIEPADLVEDPSPTSSPLTTPTGDLEASTTLTSSSPADATPLPTSESDPVSSSDTDVDTQPSGPAVVPYETAILTIDATPSLDLSSSVPSPSLTRPEAGGDTSPGASANESSTRANPLKPSTAPSESSASPSSPSPISSPSLSLPPSPTPSSNPDPPPPPNSAANLIPEESASDSDAGTDGGAPSNENPPLTDVPRGSQAPDNNAVITVTSGSVAFIPPITTTTSSRSFEVTPTRTPPAPSAPSLSAPSPPPSATVAPSQPLDTAFQNGGGGGGGQTAVQVPGTPTPDLLVPSTTQTPSDPNHQEPSPLTTLPPYGEIGSTDSGYSGSGSGVVGNSNDGGGVSTRTAAVTQSTTLLNPPSVVSSVPPKPVESGSSSDVGSVGSSGEGISLGASETGIGTGGAGGISTSSFLSYGNVFPSITSTPSLAPGPLEPGAKPTSVIYEPAVISSTGPGNVVVTGLSTPEKVTLDLVDSRPKPGAPPSDVSTTTFPNAAPDTLPLSTSLPHTNPGSVADTESTEDRVPSAVAPVQLSQGSSHDTSPGQVAVANSGSPDVIQAGGGGGPEVGSGDDGGRLQESITSTLTSTFTFDIPVTTTTDAQGHIQTSFSRVTGTSTVVTVVPGPKGSGVLANDAGGTSGAAKKGAIGGAVAGVVVIMVGVLVMLVWVRRRKYRREIEVCSRLFESPVTTPEPSSPTSPSRPANNPLHHIAYHDRDAALTDLKRPPILATHAALTHYASTASTLNENMARRVPPPNMTTTTSNPFADPLPGSGRVWQRVTYPANVRSKLGMESVTVGGEKEKEKKRESGQKAIVWWDEKDSSAEPPRAPPPAPQIVVVTGPIPVYGPALPPPPPVAQVQGRADPFADPITRASDAEQLQNPFDDLLGVSVVPEAEEGRKSSDSRISVISTASGRRVVPGYAV